MKNNIILTGMPGAGKSTIGKRLAHQLNREFLDTDDLIEQQQEAPLAEIIRDRGTEYFNSAEMHAAESIQADGLIIATGGSMVLQADSMAHLRSIGTVVFLDVNPTRLEARLGSDRLGRIIGLDASGLEGLAERRRPFYEATCDVAIKLDGDDVEKDFQKVFTAVQDII